MFAKTCSVFRQPNVLAVFLRLCVGLCYFAILALSIQAQAQRTNLANAIVAENCLTGSPASEWDVKTVTLLNVCCHRTN